MLKYGLKDSEYTIKNALLWGNFSEHVKKSMQKGKLKGRIIHGLIAASQSWPILSQIASLAEYTIFKIHKHAKKSNSRQNFSPKANDQ